MLTFEDYMYLVLMCFIDLMRRVGLGYIPLLSICLTNGWVSLLIHTRPV
jgi:hypothetical protein